MAETRTSRIGGHQDAGCPHAGLSRGQSAPLAAWEAAAPLPPLLAGLGDMPVTARQCAVASSTSPERARGLPAPLPAAVGVGSPGSPPQTWRLSVPRETRKPAGARAGELRPRWGPASDGQRGLSSCRAGPRGDRKNEEAPTSGGVGPPVF